MRVFVDGGALALWPVAAGLLVVTLVGLALRGRRPAYLLCAALFGLYLLAVVNIVFFPIFITEGEPWRRLSVNLVPFRVADDFMRGVALRQMAQNALLTVPFGFGVWFVARRLRWQAALWLGPAVGITLEGLQLLGSLVLGYAYRTVDITDFLMNTLGVWLGYGAFRVFGWVYTRAAKRFSGLASWPLFAYLHECVE